LKTTGLSKALLADVRTDVSGRTLLVQPVERCERTVNVATVVQCAQTVWRQYERQVRGSKECTVKF
jgi:hypothetical protein